ncbi:hypothetical protein [Streptomyces sp. AC495_CC817]|uniref:hypothetical protein n=1 Tax=Streptomyces sp. AC495_CC817 TaxID=2823900 RepID=UPI001C27D104|nr:hypothetical protein [Streptomyces sp. AC495_CC817]
MSALESAKGFRKDDVVFVGPAEDLATKTTWKILSLWEATDCLAYATCASGLSGRIQSFPIERLTRYPDGHTVARYRVLEPA